MSTICRCAYSYQRVLKIHMCDRSRLSETLYYVTNASELVPHQVQMYGERVRTVGISLLSGISGVEGP